MPLDERDYMKSPVWQRRQKEWEAGASRGGAGNGPPAERPAESRPAPRPAPNGRLGRRRGVRRLLPWLVAVVLVPAAGIGGFAAGASERGQRLNPFAAEPVLVWAGEEFHSKREFRGWLAERGKTYQDWARRYPGAAAKLDGAASK